MTELLNYGITEVQNYSSLRKASSLRKPSSLQKPSSLRKQGSILCHVIRPLLLIEAQAYAPRMLQRSHVRQTKH